MGVTLAWPLAYFLTFTCYGTWLHGDARGPILRNKARGGTRKLGPSALRESIARDRLKNEPPHLGSGERGVVDATIREVCEHRGWNLLALNVRTNHVHIVVYAEAKPDRVMSDLKAWTSRRLADYGLVARGSELWTSGGSKRQLWRQEHVDSAVEYVATGQGADLPRDWPPKQPRDA